MGKYNGAVITAAGQNLIAQAIAESKTVTFTTAHASSHVDPSSTDFETLTALTDVEKTVDINYAGVYSDTVVQVSARFDNDGVETAYLINTLGFFAQLGTDTPILFAVSTAVTPDQMPVFDADNPSAFIYNMQITVQNADSINVSVNPAGTVTVEQLNAAVNTINANIGDLSNLTTDDKTSLVNAVNEVDSHADTAQTSANNAQQMIAPIQTTLVASKAYAVDEQFIYNGLLYKATASIAQGGTITIDGNCELADSVTKQIKELTHTFSRGTTNFTAGFNNVDIPFSVIPSNAKCVTPYFPTHDVGGIAKITMWVMRTSSEWRISYYSWNASAISNNFAVDYIL
jgi:hypothetical protein